jgi:hypothetical protein
MGVLLCMIQSMRSRSYGPKMPSLNFKYFRGKVYYILYLK